MTNCRVIVLGVAAALMACIAAPARAQGTSRGDIAITYTFERAQIPAAGTWNLPAGFAAAVAVKISETASVVGEFGMNSMNPEKGDEPGIRIGYRTFMGGVRFGTRGNIAPFVQALAGGLMYYEGPASATSLGVELGGGVDVKVLPRLAVRLQADYQYGRVFGVGTHHIRLGAGVAFAF